LRLRRACRASRGPLNADVTTNLHNIGDIDEALIRPGRCFAVVRTRGLSREETTRFLATLSFDLPNGAEAIVERAFSGGSKTATLAELYRAISTHCQ
jgi:hypothetical protein